jgi:hypothetical protein
MMPSRETGRYEFSAWSCEETGDRKVEPATLRPVGSNPLTMPLAIGSVTFRNTTGMSSTSFDRSACVAVPMIASATDVPQA